MLMPCPAKCEIRLWPKEESVWKMEVWGVPRNAASATPELFPVSRKDRPEIIHSFPSTPTSSPTSRPVAYHDPLSLAHPLVLAPSPITMNSLQLTPQAPHRLLDIRLSPSRSSSSQRPCYRVGPALTNNTTVSHNVSHSRKRKADDDEPSPEEAMSSSPSNSPSQFTRSLPAGIRLSNKRARSGPAGRPLGLPRLLETLDAQELRQVLQNMCTRHPDLVPELENTAPRPSVSSALTVLKKYEQDLSSAFPFGGDPASDYAYNRIKQPLMSLLDALADFTPHFLPPNETQPNQSLQFLDGTTEIVHRLPEWHSYQNQLHKQNAYEEIAGAWSFAIRESAKRAGGMQLVYGGWDQKIKEHNVRSGGRLQEAVDELAGSGVGADNQAEVRSADLNSLRQEMLSGTYGGSHPVRVGPW